MDRYAAYIRVAEMARSRQLFAETRKLQRMIGRNTYRSAASMLEMGIVEEPFTDRMKALKRHYAGWFG